MNEPDRHRVAIEFPITRLDPGDDDEDGVDDPKDCQKNEADQAAFALDGLRRGAPSALLTECGCADKNNIEVRHGESSIGERDPAKIGLRNVLTSLRECYSESIREQAARQES